MYLIPVPQYWSRAEGVFTVTYCSKIVIDSSCELDSSCPTIYEYAVMLQKEFQTFAGFAPAVMRGKSGETSIIINMDGKLEKEEYSLSVTAGGVKITGGSKAGLLYGIQTLCQIIRQEGVCLPCMIIRDHPEIENRGYYFDVTRGRIPTLDWLKKLADKLAFYKMNQLQLYIEHSFLFENLSEVWRDDTPLTAQDILEFDAYCRKLNIELIPSISTFGHLYKVLRTKTYEHLCEFPDSRRQPFGFVDRMEHHTIDVSNPEGMRFVKKLIEEFLPLFTSEHFNICADETFDLGKGRSKKFADQTGVDRMYLDYVNELCKFVIEKGKKPMFWGDIISGFPQAAAELPKETICLNWGYAPDQSHEPIRKLAEAGAVQYCCPGVCGWDQFVNQIEDSYQNIKRMCTYAVQYGAVGILTTDWGDCGHINHSDFGITGMIYGAAFSWNREIPEFEEINRQISKVEYLDSSEKLVSLLAEISKHWVFKWRDAVNYMENRAPAFTMEELSKTGEELEYLQKITGELYAILPNLLTETRGLIKPYLVAIQGMELFQKIGVVLGERTYHAEPVIQIDAWKLAEELEKWFYYYKEVWRTTSRESELYRIQNVVYWYADYLRE